jgi:DNA polymerase II small subunit
MLLRLTTIGMDVPRPSHVRVVKRLTSNGYNADRDAVTVFANAEDPIEAVDRALETVADDVLTITVEDAEEAVTQVTGSAASSESEAVDPIESDAVSQSESDTDAQTDPDPASSSESDFATRSDSKHTQSTDTDSPPSPDLDTGANGDGTTTRSPDTITSSGEPVPQSSSQSAGSAPETKGDRKNGHESTARADIHIANDITGESTGTGTYTDFVQVFRDRYDRLAGQLRSRVNHRPTDALEKMAGGSEAGIVGMVNDIRSTASGHWLVELEDTNGTFPVLVMNDRAIADDVQALLHDEVIGVEGTLSDDGGILFVDSMHFPDVPRTFRPSTADRPVEAALISDVHVGSQEFLDEEWSAFADWLHTPEAERVEYLLIAGDMVEGVGVYPDQDEELDIVDIYDQYEQFAESLKEVPGDMDIVMIPGNHDAVRLAEPQPAFDEELREIMAVHDATITGNPSTVTVEGVSILMYHGVSIDELVAELPADLASYEEPQKAMAQLLRKRHLAPPFGGHMRISPEESDYLVIDDVPDVFHTGHVHKLGVGQYHNVRLVNSGCWQAQTAFQKSVNITPDTATAPILDLETLGVTVRKFR